MATEKKETKSKKTKTKKTSKAKNVNLTYNPLFSASQALTLYLYKKVVSVENGEEIITKESSIEGLPGLLTVKAGEVITVTDEQYQSLDKMGYIEHESDINHKKNIESQLGSQHPERLTYDMMNRNLDATINPREASKLYSDGLTVVD